MIHSSAFIHSTAVVDNGSNIGLDSKIWHFSHIMSKAVIGQQCNIGQNVFIADNVKIGNNVKIQNNVSLYEGVICEDDVFIGPSAVFTNVKNPRSSISRKDQYKKTILKKGVSIGANATIVCGIELGEYSFVAAGAVVTKEVLPFSMVAGVPAEHKYWISKAGHKLEFTNGTANCPETNERYLISERGILLAD